MRDGAELPLQPTPGQRYTVHGGIMVGQTHIVTAVDDARFGVLWYHEGDSAKREQQTTSVKAFLYTRRLEP